MAKTAKKLKKKPKQSYLPDLEPPSIPEIDEAADAFFDLAREKAKVQKEEDEAKEKLIEVMKKNKLKRYETPDGKVVTVAETSKSKVKVEQVYHPEDANGQS